MKAQWPFPLNSLTNFHDTSSFWHLHNMLIFDSGSIVSGIHLFLFENGHISDPNGD